MSISCVEAAPFARFTNVIAVADVVESVRLMEQDEQQFIRRWQAFVGFVHQHLPLETGRMLKSLGDGVMLEFSDPQGCIRTAVAMQAWFDEGNLGLPPEQHVQLRIGAHIAEFVADQYDIYGIDVNLTQRIATLAGPGEIVISASLREKIGGNLGTHVEDLGACHLKHLKRTVRAYRVGRPGRAPIVLAALPGRLSMRAAVAVLPFACEGMEQAVAALGEAVADQTVVALARSSELQVISRLATASIRDESGALEGLQRNLQPNYVLRGHARRLGPDLGVLAELTDADSGRVVWADSFQGPLSDLGAREPAMVRALARGVTGGVIANEVRATQEQSLPWLEGYRVLLAAVALMHRLTPTDTERALAMLEHLVERNRRHPCAYAWIAQLHMLQVEQATAGSADHAQQARDCCQAALQSDSQSPFAQCIDGYTRLHLLKDTDAAGRCYAQVLSGQPDEAFALLLAAERLALLGDGAAALHSAERALHLCLLAPMHYFYEHVAAGAALCAGRTKHALRLAERSSAANPAYVPGCRTLAMAQALSGRREQARLTMRHLLELHPAFSVRQFLQGSAAAPGVATRMAEALASAGAPLE